MDSEVTLPIMTKNVRSWRLAFCLYLITFTALAFPHHCTASRVRTLISGIARQNSGKDQTRTTSSVILRYEHAENHLVEGIKLIESMKVASSCKVKATQELLESCSYFDGTKPEGGRSSDELEKVKSQFAARLTVCELQEAENPPTLSICSHLGSSHPSVVVNRRNLAACVRELQDNVVYWASYVNSVQNVGYMCQVARADIEKEELAEQRRASLQTTLLVTRVLSEFQQSVAKQNAEILTHAQKLKELHRQNAEEMALARNETSAALQQAREEFSAQVQSLADKAGTAIVNVTASASASNDGVVRYGEHMQHSLEKIWQMMAEGNAELAAHQLQSFTESHEMAMLTQRALETIHNIEIGGLSEALSRLSSDLLLAGNQVNSIRHEHSSLAESLDQSVAKSLHVADTLDQLNMPVLEMFAKAASLVNSIFSNTALTILGFVLPVVLLLLLTILFQFRMLFWLLQLGILLSSLSYAILYAWRFWDSSPAIRKVLYASWQSISISSVLLAIYYLAFPVFRRAWRFFRPKHQSNTPNLNVAAEIDDEASRLKRARKKSVENAMRRRSERASTAPP